MEDVPSAACDSTAGKCLAAGEASRCAEYASSQGCCSLIWVKTYSSTTPHPKIATNKTRSKTTGPSPITSMLNTHTCTRVTLSSCPALPQGNLPPFHLPPTFLPPPPPYFRDAGGIWGSGEPPFTPPAAEPEVGLGTGGADAAALHFGAAGRGSWCGGDGFTASPQASLWG